jgi:hydrogenase expression/formation protein HypE
MGDHGLAVLAARGQLALEVELRSDVAPVNGLVRAALAVGGDAITAMKDPTRGGLASALHELAAKAGVGILLDETAVPIRDDVRAVGELLGIDPLHVANEGKVVMGVRADRADAVLARGPGPPARSRRCPGRHLPGRGPGPGRPRHRVRSGGS